MYERTIAHVPAAQEKRFWRQYIYLWIYYVLYEELVAKDVDCKCQVYRTCLELVPHKKFTFAKICVMFSHFEMRQKDLAAARKILGPAIGKSPKPKLLKSYIELNYNSESLMGAGSCMRNSSSSIRPFVQPG